MISSLRVLVLLFKNVEDSSVSWDFLYEWWVLASVSLSTFDKRMCLLRIFLFLAGRLITELRVHLLRGGLGVTAWVEAARLLTLAMLIECSLSSLQLQQAVNILII